MIFYLVITEKAGKNITKMLRIITLGTLDIILFIEAYLVIWYIPYWLIFWQVLSRYWKWSFTWSRLFFLRFFNFNWIRWLIFSFYIFRLLNFSFWNIRFSTRRRTASSWVFYFWLLFQVRQWYPTVRINKVPQQGIINIFKNKNYI